MTESDHPSYLPEFDIERLLSQCSKRSPEYQAVWDWMIEQDKDLPDQTNMTIVQQRALRERTSARWNAHPPAVASVERIEAPGLNGQPAAACELHVPFDAKPGAILYLHGGGWAFGGLRSHIRLARNIALAVCRPVLVLDYRLAPENPYPAALDDVVAAWRWLVGAGERDGRLRGPLAIAGDSAGANLGVCAMLREIEARRRIPDCGLFFYGVYSGDVDSPSYRRFATGHGLNRVGMEKFWSMYAGAPGADGRWRDPFVSPLDAPEGVLRALPPLYLAAAGLDPLLCDTLAFGARLRAAGGQCEAIVHEGVQHGFVQITERLEEAQRAIRLAGQFFLRVVGDLKRPPSDGRCLVAVNGLEGGLCRKENRMRPSKRALDQMRTVTIERNVSRYAEGSCLIKFGETHVLCTASLEDKPPMWLRGQGRGWITAEYSMLPRATHTRSRREVASGKPSGRTQEIQRLIGRSLRAVVDLAAMGERQITIDCDVLQADGGTRTASISGGWVALHDCLKWMRSRSMFKESPLRDHVAAVSCGRIKGETALDLDYAEDSTAETDANFVITGRAQLVEVQASAEAAVFTEADLTDMLALAKSGVAHLVELQKNAVA